MASFLDTLFAPFNAQPQIDAAKNTQDYLKAQQAGVSSNIDNWVNAGTGAIAGGLASGTGAVGTGYNQATDAAKLGYGLSSDAAGLGYNLSTGALSPLSDLFSRGAGAYADATGVNGAPAGADAMSRFFATNPSWATGLEAVKRGTNTGGGLSGGQALALQGYGGDAFNKYLASLSPYNSLATTTGQSLATAGQNYGTALGNYGQNFGNTLGGYGITTGNNLASLFSNAGNNIAALGMQGADLSTKFAGQTLAPYGTASTQAGQAMADAGNNFWNTLGGALTGGTKLWGQLNQPQLPGSGPYPKV